MDYEGLFWIALVVFYFVMRALGGKRGKQPRQQPSRRPRRETVQGGSEREPELDDALREIRRALGFPDEERRADERSGEPAVDSPRTGAPTERRPLQDRTAAAPQPERPLGEGTMPNAQAERERRDAKMRDAAREQAERKHEVEQRQAELSAGTNRVADRTGQRLGTSKHRGGRTSRKEGAHPLDASFMEEEAFERTGPHGHIGRHDLQVVSPYDTPPKKKLPGLMRRLSRRSSLREAILMKEILDRPLALRGRR